MCFRMQCVRIFGGWFSDMTGSLRQRSPSNWELAVEVMSARSLPA